MRMRRHLAVLFFSLLATVAVAAPRETQPRQPRFDRIIKVIRGGIQSLGDLLSPPHP
jgi:hypothetical protein